MDRSSRACTAVGVEASRPPCPPPCCLPSSDHLGFPSEGPGLVPLAPEKAAQPLYRPPPGLSPSLCPEPRAAPGAPASRACPPQGPPWAQVPTMASATLHRPASLLRPLPSSLPNLSAHLSTYLHAALGHWVSHLGFCFCFCLFVRLFVLCFVFLCFSPSSPGCPVPPPPPLPPPAVVAGDEAAARGAAPPPLTPPFPPAVLRPPLPPLPCLFSPSCLSYSLLGATLGVSRGLAHPVGSPPSFPPTTASPTPVKRDAPLVQDAAGNSNTPSCRGLTPRPRLKAIIQAQTISCGQQTKGRAAPHP